MECFPLQRRDSNGGHKFDGEDETRPFAVDLARPAMGEAMVPDAVREEALRIITRGRGAPARR